MFPSPPTATIHRVRVGAADLFALAPDGARFPLLRVENGAIFCAQDGIVAVPTLGARLESVAREAVTGDEWHNWQQALDGALNGETLRQWLENRSFEAQTRLQNRAKLEDAARGQGWRGLWRVLDGPRARNLAATGAGHPFLEAAARVFEASGIELEMPPAAPFPATFASEIAAQEAVKTLSNLSRVRSREVILDGDWWRQDAGALLGFALESADSTELRAVAFLPSGGGTRVFDPRGDLDGVWVGAQNAARFAPRATVWTRPFPPRALKPLDVLRFGARGLKNDLAWIVSLSLLGGLLGLLPPLVTAQVFDSVLPGAESARLWPLVALLVAFALASAALSAVRGIAISRVESRLDASLQSALWDRLMRLSPDFFRPFTAGDLANRALAIGGVRQLLAGAVVSSLLGGIFSLLNWVLLFSFDARLALVATLVMLLGGSVSLLSGALQLRYERQKNALAGEVSGLTLQLLQGVSSLQVGGATGRAFEVWAGRFAARKSAADARAGRAKRRGDFRCRVSASGVDGAVWGGGMEPEGAFDRAISGV